MKKRLCICTVLVAILVMMTACSGPADTSKTPMVTGMPPSPTATAEPTTEPTATPQPTQVKELYKHDPLRIPQFALDFVGEDQTDDLKAALTALYQGESEVKLPSITSDKSFERFRRALTVLFAPMNLLDDYRYTEGRGPMSFDAKTQTLTIRYASDKDTYLQKIDDFNKLIESIFDENVTDVNNEFETARELFGYVVKSTTYNDDHKLNRYDAFILGEAYCQTYSQKYQYLLWQAGIECYLVGSIEGVHEWNAVRLGDDYYYMDTTWDEGNYFYFGMDFDKCAETHRVSDFGKAQDPLFDGWKKLELTCDNDQYNDYWETRETNN